MSCYTNKCGVNVTKRYVGSRYVPKLEGRHDLNREYENFSIVVDVNNNSYTSKKIVPVGIPLSNGEYWVQTGNYEGILEEVDKKVDDHIKASDIKFKQIDDDTIIFKENVNNAFKDINKKVDDHIEESRQSFIDINQKIDNVNKEVEDIGNEIDNIKDKDIEQDGKIKAIEDSLAPLDDRVVDLENNATMYKENIVNTPSKIFATPFIKLTDGMYNFKVIVIPKDNSAFHTMEIDILIANNIFIQNGYNIYSSDQSFLVNKYTIIKSSTSNDEYAISIELVIETEGKICCNYTLLTTV